MALAGKRIQIEGDAEIWRVAEQDPYEWSTEYNDYLVFYSEDTAEGYAEEEHSTWTWLKSALTVVGELVTGQRAEERGGSGGAGGSGSGGGRKRGR